jgi:N-methylhydantoinase A
MATAQQAARASGGDESLRLISFDMGGTSTDVSMIAGAPQITTEAVIGGCPIRVPLMDVHTIGAGGGSIAALDAGGALRVGPHSAGADPGPACYGRGDLPTVTDANLVLGRLLPEQFLGGQMRLDLQRAWSVVERLGAAAGISVEQAALGVVEVVNAHMERALRVISVERGYDPADFTLLSFGGAGGLHAADLARRLGIRRLLVPPLASTLSAFGMLAADVVKDFSQTVMLPGDTDLEEIQRRLALLSERGRQALRAEGFPDDAILLNPQVDVRYRGQSYELSVRFGPGYQDEFHRLHEFTYGYRMPNAPLELVNLRLRAAGRVAAPQLAVRSLQDLEPPAPARYGKREVMFTEGKLECACYLGELLQPGNRLSGPALVVRSDTTILLGRDDRAEVDRLGNLLVQVGEQAQGWMADE